jgi:hypothetical protein
MHHERDTKPTPTEMIEVIDQLAFVAEHHAQIAGSTAKLVGEVDSEDRIRQALELIADGERQMADALAQVSTVLSDLLARDDG